MFSTWIVKVMTTWYLPQIDVFPVWNAWGHALIRMEHYAQARVKFKYVEYMYTLNFIAFVKVN